MEINKQTKVCQKKEVYLTDLDEDRVMMDIETGNYYILNGMGGIIWDKIKRTTSVNQLIENLLEEYNVESNICEEQVITYLERLQKISLITVEN